MLTSPASKSFSSSHRRALLYYYTYSHTLSHSPSLQAMPPFLWLSGLVLVLLTISSSHAFLFPTAAGPLQHDRQQQRLKQCTPTTAAAIPVARVPSTPLFAAGTGVAKAADAEK